MTQPAAKPSSTTSTRTTTSTQTDPYKTEFVKVYQDAGVIGVAMLTLLVICALLSILAFRLAKMYSTLVTSRDALDEKRLEVSEKLTAAVLEVKAEVGLAEAAINQLRTEAENLQKQTMAEVRFLCDRVDRIADQRRSEPAPRSPERGKRRGY
jgi:HAMP domain-containing protein